MNKFKNLTLLQKFLFIVFFSSWTNFIMAATSDSTTLGDAASGALVPVNIFITALYNICYILGTVFVLGSGIRYKDYRDNPTQTPISRPIMLFIFGLILLVLPFVAKLSQKV